MDRIWAPWRMKYLKSMDNAETEGCIFCWKPESTEDQKNLIIERSQHCFTLMNLYPYNNSHLMVVPYKHTSDFLDLEPEELLDCQNAIARAVRVLKNSIEPHGFNVGMNLGRAGGAGIDAHLHWHLVPRWNGDTNFMPVTGGTKVISESIQEGYQRLLEAWHKGAE